MSEAALMRTAVSEDERLARIAELVGRPVEAFREPDNDTISAALELVKLWERIDAAGRARLLACARAEAARTAEPQQGGHAAAGLRGALR